MKHTWPKLVVLLILVAFANVGYSDDDTYTHGAQSTPRVGRQANGDSLAPQIDGRSLYEINKDIARLTEGVSKTEMEIRNLDTELDGRDRSIKRMEESPDTPADFIDRARQSRKELMQVMANKKKSLQRQQAELKTAERDSKHLNERDFKEDYASADSEERKRLIDDVRTSLAPLKLLSGAKTKFKDLYETQPDDVKNAEKAIRRLIGLSDENPLRLGNDSKKGHLNVELYDDLGNKYGEFGADGYNEDKSIKYTARWYKDYFKSDK